MRITKIKAIRGKKMASTESITEVTDSTAETTGFASPAVAVVDARRVVEVELFMAVAVPPPAIMANTQVKKGSKSAMVDSMIAVPATAAKGTAIVSKIWSIHGIK